MNHQQSTLQQLTKEYHRLQDNADDEFKHCEEIYENLADASQDEKRDQLIEARGHLSRASDNLHDSLDLRHQAYHHLGVDEGHQKWEERLQSWITKNRALDRKYALEHLELCSLEESEQRREEWQQFRRKQEELKAFKRELEAQDQHMLPVFGPHELPRAQPVTWKKTVWQKGNVAPAVNDGPATQQTKRISFRLPSVQVPADRMPTYQTPAQQAMAGYTPPYQMRALQTLTHHTPVCQERDAETDDYGY